MQNTLKQRARRVGMDASAADYAGSDALPVINALEVLQTAGPRSFKAAKARAEKALYDYQTVDFEEALKLKALISTAKPLPHDPQPSRNPCTGLQEFSDQQADPYTAFILKQDEQRRMRQQEDESMKTLGLNPDRVRYLQERHDRMSTIQDWSDPAKDVARVLGASDKAAEKFGFPRVARHLAKWSPAGRIVGGLGAVFDPFSDYYLTKTENECKGYGLGPDCR